MARKLNRNLLKSNCQRPPPEVELSTVPEEYDDPDLIPDDPFMRPPYEIASPG
jgi:hypothetical protein